MIDYIKIDYTSREEWLEQRRKTIGASEAATVMGANPWQSKLELWGIKTGRIPEPDLEDNEPVFWGQQIEPVIIAGFSERSGRKAEYSGELLRSTHYPWASCTLDGICWVNGLVRPLEVKNIGIRQASKWEDGPPEYYWWQVQHQMLVTNAKVATIAALCGGQRLLWSDVDRDETAIEMLKNKTREFWELCQKEQPPEPDGSESSKSALSQLYPKDDGESMNLPGSFEEIDSALVTLKEDRKRIDDEIRSLENSIKATLGDATEGYLPSGVGYSWKLQERKETVIKASNFRVLRRHKPKV